MIGWFIAKGCYKNMVITITCMFLNYKDDRIMGSISRESYNALDRVQNSLSAEIDL